MTRKHFQMIAEVIRDTPMDRRTRTILIAEFRSRLREFNSAFNGERFEDVCLGERKR